MDKKHPTIGLIEVPATGLYDAEGKNWTSLYRHRSLISKQVLISDLQAGGFDARLVNLRDGDYSEEFGQNLLERDDPAENLRRGQYFCPRSSRIRCLGNYRKFFPRSSS